MSATPPDPRQPGDGRLDPRGLARAKREAMAARARRIRRWVAGTTVTLFVVAFLVVYVQLASGHDPALTANAERRASSSKASAAARKTATERAKAQRERESSGSESTEALAGSSATESESSTSTESGTGTSTETESGSSSESEESGPSSLRTSQS
jgi:type IV secretory pathway TrbL component